MKVYQDKSFEASYPERFAWSQLDSVKLSMIACAIIGKIMDEQRQGADNRILTPGLRSALNLMALEADL